MKKQDTMPTQKSITTGAISGSEKIYVPGKIHDIKVAMREIKLSPTKLTNGKSEDNAPVTVYDTGGAYTDNNITIDIKKGLPRLREKWILDRGDVEPIRTSS